MIQGLELNTHSFEGKVNLDDAYTLCANVTREYSKSFFISTGFLPEPIRRAIRAFYAFCRATDDMVDLPSATAASSIGAGEFSGLGQSSTLGHPNTLGHPSTLGQWRSQCRLPAAYQTNPILSAWADARDRHGVPQQYIEELIDGCEMDLRIHRYETFEELSTYCYRVASTVGLVSMHIIGTITDQPDALKKARDAAINLGIALQLTNILRDVGEDLTRGRIYLPLEDMRRFNYSESDLRNHTINHNFCSLMRFEIERTRALYDNDWGGIVYLKPEGRLAVGAAISLYQAIMERIMSNGFDVFTRRAHLSTVAKLARIPGVYLRVRRLQRPCTE